MKVSIIIITKNEEKYLPRLLESIKRQDFKDYEIIVSDAHSTDKTCRVAKKYGCKVVNGGLPGAGRNKGAKAAKGQLFLFLDADVVLLKHFLKRTIREFREKKLDIATCYYKIKKNSRTVDKLLLGVANTFLFLSQFTKDPRCTGSFILCKRETFDKLHGFNEKLIQAEDHDFAKRAKKCSKFRVLLKTIGFCTRRWDVETRRNYVKKVLKVELYRRFKGEIKHELFEYDYGNFK